MVLGHRGSATAKDWLMTDVAIAFKRHKIRHVSINSLLLQELKQYRTALGLDELPSSGEKYGLVIPLKGDQIRRLTPRAIWPDDIRVQGKGLVGL